MPELKSNGILSYDKDRKVYIGIAFMPDCVDEVQLKSIAKSIKISDVE